MNDAGTASLFRLEHVSFTYQGRQPALDDVDLAFATGEPVAILGANGSGKSTLLKILDGLYRPSSGRFEAFGQDATTIADDSRESLDYHRRVGLVFQDPDVQLFSPTVWDDVAFGPLQLSMVTDEVQERVRRALEMMDVANLSARAPYELSGGEKKRVAIATVLAIDPEVILLDEPTANLDPRSRDVLLDLLIGLTRLGKTVITTTHELDIVPYISQRVIVFGDRAHRPVADGPPATILAATDVLVEANLIHVHAHAHGAQRHSHPHWHDDDHRNAQHSQPVSFGTPRSGDGRDA